MIKHSLMKINLSFMDMVYYLKLQHEMSFLTRFLQNPLSCSCFTEIFVRKSRELDSTAPPTLIAFPGYEVNSQSLLQRKVARNLDSQLPFLSLFTHAPPPTDQGGGERWWWCWKRVYSAYGSLKKN